MKIEFNFTKKHIISYWIRPHLFDILGGTIQLTFDGHSKEIKFKGRDFDDIKNKMDKFIEDNL